MAVYSIRLVNGDLYICGSCGSPLSFDFTISRVEFFIEARAVLFPSSNCDRPAFSILGQSAKQTVTMDVFESFDVAARQLLLRQGIKVSKFQKLLRNIIETASEDFRPVQVLYYDSHDGYKFSNAFESFMDRGKKATLDSLATRCALQSVPQLDHDSIQVV